MFVPHGTKASDGLEALGTAVAGGSVRMFTATACWLLASKTILDWLWSDLDQLDPADAAVVRQHVPRTEILTAGLREQVLADRNQLVLKPNGSYGGVGVVVGPEVDEATWANAVEEALSEGGYIVQHHIDVDRLTMQFVHLETEETAEADVPFCVAPYLFAGIPAGAYLRFTVPGAGPVVNVGQGALTSGLLLVP
jgi:uncharacterized circularly permuted ATP-grasp superfamily protein